MATPLQDAPLKDLPFCNTSLTAGQRTDDLVSRLTLDQLIGQMGHQAPAVPSLGIPAYNWWTECLHGVLTKCGTNCPTSFPAPCALGAAFNMKLIHKMARAISNEARALNNEGIGGLDFWAPNIKYSTQPTNKTRQESQLRNAMVCISINRDPRWGRNMEVPGEDPFMTAQYVAHFMRGLQEGEDSRYPQVVGTCKHFAAYSLEAWKDYDRFMFDAIVSDYDFVETYLPAFKGCIVEGRARSIMCSYNSVNGVPSCANDFLLRTILRDSWSFDGYVVSDCDAVDTIYNNHHFTKTPEGACAVALHAGTDLNCGDFYQKHLGKAHSEGRVTEDEVRLAVKRLFRQRMELGMWDPPAEQPYKQYPPSVVGSREHSDLALQAARESMVLLQNRRGVLPLRKSVRRVAVIGPNANATETMLGNYYGSRCHDGTYDCIVSPYLAIKAKLPQALVTYNLGCDVDSTNTTGIPEAVKAAQAADVAIVVLGLNTSVESEGKDRVAITLPGMQDHLIKSIVATNTPTVVVMMHGGAVAIEWIKDQVDGIVDAFYPGENGGQAIADVLFGDYNPGDNKTDGTTLLGRLPVTVLPANYVDMVPLTNMSMRASGNNPGRTYRYYTGPAPLWEFGFGLSYTTFKTEWLSTPQPSALKSYARDEAVSFRVRVTNVGPVAGDEVVLAFVTRDNADRGPLKQLFAFERVHLNPGESKEIFFNTGPDTLAVATDGAMEKVVHPGIYQGKLVHPIEVVGPAFAFPAV
ncbi:betaxylosidase [Acanthamoeba castellanii str. Neff]|uniref:Betaxylosidase n=1 Tax=Acanthamoeba castellanii (strain ATCC 30010 / Neff) TaxID=1257118 RepID=L8H7L5_ACACF|nr:betaxylosidase [Acanthamoeba castellanii str. Neff]ELR20723.1 betaxylosidase [Acanthamoeba castellanii str. Neff]